MSGIDQQGNVILPSGAVYNPQAAVQETLSNIYGMSQGIPYIPMPQYQPSAEFGVNRFLAGDQAMPLVYDVSAPQYTPAYDAFVYSPQPFAEYAETYNAANRRNPILGYPTPQRNSSGESRGGE